MDSNRGHVLLLQRFVCGANCGSNANPPPIAYMVAVQSEVSLRWESHPGLLSTFRGIE